MNLDFIYESGASFIVATVILVFFALLIVGGIAGFLITLKRERAYARTALPDLENPEDEVVEVADDDMQILTESVFAVEDETHVLDDQDSNKLMADIDRAKLAEEKTVSSQTARNEKFSKFTNVFKKKD